MRVEVGKLVREDVRVRQNIEDFLAEALLHLYDVFAQTVFSSQLIRHREVIDLLVLVHGLVDVRLDALTCPQDVPFITFGLAESTGLHDSLDELGVRLHHLEEHLELCLLVLARLCVA